MIALNNNYQNKLAGLEFIDLFSGIGGFRLAFESFGADCVFSIDKDKHASEVYDKNYDDSSYGDITKTDAKDIPKHDILCGGFPCQAFSISGKQLGFEDTRGTLFFDILLIAKSHKPKILLLENVGNLVKHNHGKTFKVIKQSLRNIGYNIYYEVLNAGDYGIPQSRKRIYIVAIRKDIDNRTFKFPKPTHKKNTLDDILLDNSECKDYLKKEYKIDESKLRKYRNIPLNKPLRVGTVNKGGQGDRIYLSNGHAITLSATGEVMEQKLDSIMWIILYENYIRERQQD